MSTDSDRTLAARRGRTWIALRAEADLDQAGAARRWLTAAAAALMITKSDGRVRAPSPPPERSPPLTKWNWMISPGTHPRSAPEAEKVIVNQDPGAWGLFVFPPIELPPPGTAFTDTWGVLPRELLDALDRHGMEATWWFAKVPPEEGSTGEPRYLTITYHGAGEYELRNTPSSARHPFILTSASED